MKGLHKKSFGLVQFFTIASDIEVFDKNLNEIKKDLY